MISSMASLTLAIICDSMVNIGCYGIVTTEIDSDN